MSDPNAETTLPPAFEELEPWAADWAQSTRHGRHMMRRSKTLAELEAFYDAIAPRAEEAIEYLNGFDLDALTPEQTRLLRMLYSLILVSCSVNIYKQVDIPDSGSAYFETRIEPPV